MQTSIVENLDRDSPTLRWNKRGALNRAMDLSTDGSSTKQDVPEQELNTPQTQKEADMIRYLEKLKALTGGFKAFTIKQIPRSENKKADATKKNSFYKLCALKRRKDTWMTPNYKLPQVMAVTPSKWDHLQESFLRPMAKGIDIVGPFPEGPGKVKFLIVAMDYFTKWIDCKPSRPLRNQIKKSYGHLVCRFGIPGEIISNNGKQFRDDPFKDLCEKLCINQHFASVKHPQTKGPKRANSSLGEGIKARLEARSKNWIEELPHVLWAHCTMIKSSNGDTPFSLTYGTEAVDKCKIHISVRIRQISQEYRQKRANTDTRTEECARAESQSQKVNPQSKSTLEDKDPKVTNLVPQVSKVTQIVPKA
ncbi:reverse transcriptase domain-containing protein [Tanacetum coccineum]|uniref:Reverse transcriptase domain-containing protein n=1 Tax=Tanacetum coccineum TaxID=301880 RepID=A0ABQ5HW93_9ASTR